MPLFLDSYILYNSTHFREKQSLLVSAFTLTTETIATISASVAQAFTLTKTVFNLTFISPITVTEESKLEIDLAYG